MSNDEMERRLRRLRMIFQAAMPIGVSLEEFKENSSFCEHYLVTNIPLLGGKVPIKAGSGYGVTYLLRKSTEYTDNLFEIQLAAKINDFKKDNKHVLTGNRNITLYKGILIHEAAHILEGSFEPLNLEDIFNDLYGGKVPIVRPNGANIGDSSIDSIIGNDSSVYTKKDKEEKGTGSEVETSGTNSGLAADLFNIVEDYRIEVNLCDRIKSRSDFKVCLDFINLVLIGIQGEYKDPEYKAKNDSNDQPDETKLLEQTTESAEQLEQKVKIYDFINFKNAWLRKIKCGQNCGSTLSEVLSANGNEYLSGKRLEMNRASNQERYNDINEIKEFEFKFFNKETVPELQELGIYNYRDLMNNMAEKVYDLRGKNVCEAVGLLPELYRMLELQFPEPVNNYRSQRNNQCGGTGEGRSGGKGEGDQGQSKTDQNGEGDNSKSEDWNDDQNPTFGKTDDFTQGSIKPKSVDELKERKDEIQSRVDKIAENISPEHYKKKKNPVPSKDGLINNEDKDDVSKEIFYEYDSKKQQVVPSEIFNKRLSGGDPDFERRIRSLYGNVITGVYEQFEQLKLNQLQVERMQSTPHSFNPVGVVFASIDPHFASQQRFYDASLINKRNYDIALLLDGSGSTSQKLASGAQSIVNLKRKTNILDIEKIAAAIIDISFRDLEMDDDFNIRKFLYQSYRNTDLYEFDHINALTTIDPGNANRDGAAIRSVTRKLLDGKSEDKILFLFADGRPADYSYEGGVYDTKMAIKEATDQDIKVFYILTKSSDQVDSSEIEAYNEIKEFATHAQLVVRPETLPYVARDIVEMYLV
ncbi:VWA domain-containing protein [archaeon]|jgi:hypothetical protein|nr:VWA domain-containing protein [archaeon]MBT3451491.1 VWA domain-containing protein [archaeon]MBT6869741.1 VWA domain-containing protein [archaeon]MBT7192696.1 VWA domain-containing protein [archaeon]MBT7380721.1 VWA domain-containing protein [archaeon]